MQQQVPAMYADKWIFPLALCFMCASSNDEQHFEESCGQYSDLCEMHTVGTPFGSSVLLPCNFTTSGLERVSWAHADGADLLTLTSDGHVQFLLPKEGRVKVFPNQVSRGNYSIRIDELQDSDLGFYCCVQGDKCHQVDLRATTDTPSKETLPLIYICVGVVTFFLLVVSIYFLHKKRTQSNAIYLVNEEIEADAENTVYENDDQNLAIQQGEPSTKHCGPVAMSYLNTAQPAQKMERQRTIRRFQREIFDTSGKPHFSQHYYVNQDEINNQQTMSAASANHERGFRKKKAKENQEYTNPIYNRGTDQLNL
ncbi:uncharacterized protein [Paralichthys olivaceus]|uniref:uncharacterized protein isoform X2 n=1 Tax=Paralichthys olivaceus TaxID=8255 RepID=UPI003752CEB5